MMSAPPELNMTSWSILDFELAFDGLRQMRESVTWLQNQPRASIKGNYHPGAEYVVALDEEWLVHRFDDIVSRLAATRFADPNDEDRRIRFLLVYYGGYGSAGLPLAALMDMIAAQCQPIAA